MLQGLWIPVKLEKELVLDCFNFKKLTKLECNLLRRIYWEEILRHLGGDFNILANLSSNYTKTSLLKPQVPVKSAKPQ